MPLALDRPPFTRSSRSALSRTALLVASQLLISGASVAITGADALAARRGKIEYDRSGVPLTAPEYAVDRVALSYENEAIARIQKLLQAPQAARDPEQAARLRIRLAQEQQKRSDLIFRVAHNDAYRARKPIDLVPYKKSLLDLVRNLTDIVETYKTRKDLPSLYMMRGKAHQELGDRKSALKDYSFIEANYPNYEGIKGVYLELAEMAEEAEDYPLAIRYLSYLESNRTDPERYSYVLYKLAWNHYRTDNIDRAMAYIRANTQYQNSQLTTNPDARAQGVVQGRRDELITDAAVFYIRGFELKLSGYPSANAFQFFKSIAVGPQVESAFKAVLIKYASLLRAHNHYDEMDLFQSQVVSQVPDRPEALAVTLTVLEDQLNKYRYDSAIRSIDDIRRLYKSHSKRYSFKAAERLLNQSADRLQKQVARADKSEAPALTKTLEKLYATYLEVTEAGSQGAYRVRFNLAEALLALGKKDEAAGHYRTIFYAGNTADDALKAFGLGSLQAGLKAVGIMYDDLKARKIIPDTLSPRSLATQTDSPLDARYIEWVKLLLDTEKAKSKEARSEQMEFFIFEANRALYAQGRLKESLGGMRNFIKRYPQSPHLTPAARLVLDTYIASQDWATVEMQALEFAQIPQLQNAAFGRELVKLAADSSYKLAEADFNQKKYDAVLARAPEFNKRYAASERKGDFLFLASRAAMNSNQDETARSTLTQLITEAPRSNLTQQAIALRAAMSERLYDFPAAAADYRAYLRTDSAKAELSKKQRRELERKILLLAWLTAVPKTLTDALGDPELCNEQNLEVCDHYAAIVRIERGGKFPRHASRPTPPKTGKLFNDSTRGLWLLGQLEHEQGMPLDERLRLLRVLADDWTDVEPMARYVMIPRLTQMIRREFARIREEVRALRKIKADPKVISARLESIRWIETTASKVIKLPYAEIQVDILSKTAALYQDLADDIRKLPAPSDVTSEEAQVFKATLEKISTPFAETARKIRKEGFELASRSGVGHELFQQVAEQHFADDPEEGKRILGGNSLPGSAPITDAVLVEVDSDGNWDRIEWNSTEPMRRLQAQWASSIKEEKWARVAFCLQEARDRKFFSDGVLGVMKAVSLGGIGARAEGMVALEEAMPKLDAGRRDSLRKQIERLKSATLATGRVG